VDVVAKEKREPESPACYLRQIKARSCQLLIIWVTAAGRPSNTPAARLGQRRQSAGWEMPHRRRCPLCVIAQARSAGRLAPLTLALGQAASRSFIECYVGSGFFRPSSAWARSARPPSLTLHKAAPGFFVIRVLTPRRKKRGADKPRASKLRPARLLCCLGRSLSLVPRSIQHHTIKDKKQNARDR
jgi:hypothetical protein